MKAEWLGVLEYLGSLTVETFWVPFALWTGVALPVYIVLRSRALRPHLHYQLARAALFSLPFGLLLLPLVARLATPGQAVPVLIWLPSDSATIGAALSAPASWSHLHAIGLVSILAAAAALWRLLSLTLQTLRLSGYRRRAEPGTPGAATRFLAKLLRESGVSRSVEVLTIAENVTPVTFGWRHPVVVLPEHLLHEEDDLRLVLTHEAVHIRRRDYLSHWIDQLVAAPFVAHPLVAALLREISLGREMTCDTAVMAATGRRSSYARLLYRCAMPLPSELSGAVGILLRETHLKQRIRAMKTLLDLHHLRRDKRIGLIAACVLLVLSAGIVACSEMLVEQEQVPAALSKSGSEDFVVVEDMPELVGGLGSIQQLISYPVIAKKAGIEGRVIVQFVVDEEGRVVEPKVVKGIGAGCDEAALRAVEQAQFKPGLQHGKPVRVKMSLPITFKLAEGTNSREPAAGSQDLEDKSALNVRIEKRGGFSIGNHYFARMDDAVRYVTNERFDILTVTVSPDQSMKTVLEFQKRLTEATAI